MTDRLGELEWSAAHPKAFDRSFKRELESWAVEEIVRLRVALAEAQKRERNWRHERLIANERREKAETKLWGEIGGLRVRWEVLAVARHAEIADLREQLAEAQKGERDWHHEWLTLNERCERLSTIDDATVERVAEYLSDRDAAEWAAAPPYITDTYRAMARGALEAARKGAALEAARKEEEK